MTDRDNPPDPLWAYSLADQPRPDVIARVLEEEPGDAPRPPRERPPAPRPALFLGALAAVGLVAVTLVLRDGGSWMVVDVPSYWGDIPMTCHTTRLEQGDRAVEWFDCRALGGGELPAGLYESPDSQWTSDITRRDARESRIRISRDGEVVGWAKY